MMLEKIIRYIVYGFFKICFRLKVRNARFLPESGGVIIAANHTSYLDPPIIGVCLNRRPTFIAKSSLFKIPLVGQIIKAYSIGVKRENPTPSTIKKALRVLRDGGALVIFPEGGRSHDGSLKDIKRGVGLLASLSDVPVVPACIKGAHRALPVGARVPRPKKIEVVFGRPIRRKEGESPKAYEERLTKEIYASLNELRRSGQ